MDVIPDALSWPEAHQTLTTESSAVNQTVEEPLGFVKHPPGLCACRSVVTTSVLLEPIRTFFM